MVGSASLRDTPHGAPVGIDGAPDALPGAGDLDAGPWQVCSGTGSGSTGTTLAVGARSDAPGLPATQGAAGDRARQGRLSGVAGQQTAPVRQLQRARGPRLRFHSAYGGVGGVPQLPAVRPGSGPSAGDGQGRGRTVAGRPEHPDRRGVPGHRAGRRRALLPAGARGTDPAHRHLGRAGAGRPGHPREGVRGPGAAGRRTGRGRAERPAGPGVERTAAGHESARGAAGGGRHR